MASIYLDHAATTPIDPVVVSAMSQAYGRFAANPSSQHQAGRRAKRALDDAGDGILQLLGGEIDHAGGDRIVITSGGTEANNLALLGLLQTEPGRILVSSIEHPSTMAAAGRLGEAGWQVESIGALESGQIDLDDLAKRLDAPVRRPALVSVMLGNNETGVVQPVEQVVQLCEPRGIPVHTDAVQAIGRQRVDFTELGATMMTIAAHKFHGPVGVGALLLRGQTPLRPILFGGAQQLGSRPGTESVALTIGMHVALRLGEEHRLEGAAHLAHCRDALQGRLMELPEARINGSAHRLPHILNVSFLGIDRQALLMALDLARIHASTGSACASGSSEPSHVLRAMGLPAERIESALRLSVGATTTDAEVALAADRILNAVSQLRA